MSRPPLPARQPMRSAPGCRQARYDAILYAHTPPSSSSTGLDLVADTYLHSYRCNRGRCLGCTVILSRDMGSHKLITMLLPSADPSAIAKSELHCFGIPIWGRHDIPDEPDSKSGRPGSHTKTGPNVAAKSTGQQQRDACTSGLACSPQATPQFIAP